MRKAEFERALKGAAAGKPLKEIVVALDNGTRYNVRKIHFDHEADTIIITISDTAL